MAKKVHVVKEKAVVKTDVKEKRAALENAIAAAEKKFGKGSIMILGNQAIPNLPVITTGLLSLDLAIGVLGIPRGRIIEIFGAPAGGKSTLCLQIVAEVQKAGGTALFVDAEHALDLQLAKGIGVDVNTMLLSQPDYGEQALQIVEDFVESGSVDLIVVDSVAALVPLSEIQGEMGDLNVGKQARLMSQALRKLTAVVSKTKTIVIFVNQVRKTIGNSWGPTETTTGGEALKFYASVRLDARRVEAIKKAEVVIGARTRIKVVKNKVAPPFRETIVDIIFGRGVSKERDLLATAVLHNIIGKNGSWYVYKEDRLGQGEDEAAAMLAKDPIFFDTIRAAVIEKVKKEVL